MRKISGECAGFDVWEVGIDGIEKINLFHLATRIENRSVEQGRSIGRNQWVKTHLAGSVDDGLISGCMQGKRCQGIALDIS